MKHHEKRGNYLLFMNFEFHMSQVIAILDVSLRSCCILSFSFLLIGDGGRARCSYGDAWRAAQLRRLMRRSGVRGRVGPRG